VSALQGAYRYAPGGLATVVTHAGMPLGLLLLQPENSQLCCYTLCRPRLGLLPSCVLASRCCAAGSGMQGGCNGGPPTLSPACRTAVVSPRR
jgi:hypothetical protein